MLANGAISYQEDTCKLKGAILKTKNSIKTKSEHTTVSFIYPLTEKKLRKITVGNDLIKNISNQVKGYRISMNVLNSWSIVNKVYNDKLLHMRFLDNTKGSEMSFMLDFIYTDGKVFSITELNEIIYLLGSRYVDGSVEAGVKAVSVKLLGGRGMMATFTESKIVKNYRYAIKGVIYKNNWLVQFTLLSNNSHSQSQQLALQTVFENIRIQKL